MTTAKDPELTALLADPPPIGKGALGCMVRRFKNEHPNGEEIANAVSDVRWSAAALSRALRSKGIEMSSSTITNHRKGACSCRAKSND